MSDGEVAALLDRLVAQFEGPYDFLRELVQNSLDAGSDRAEVALEVHPGEGEDPDEVVYELRVVDAGAGMDEAIIDGGLTRLFASTKADDRTMAGGFGIGFVSVFAWQPDAVVVHTGRAGEAWELTFYADKRFDKRALAEPWEGTTVTLLRRGRAHERAQIAEAVRDSLWRWCRFCRLELSFEDVAGGEGPELIQDAPAPPGALAVVDEAGDGAVHVAFAVPPEAVMLRRGLVLAQGPAADLLADLAPAPGRTLEHLQVWADSPGLRTTMARDKVVEDEGRAAVLGRVARALAGLRTRLLEKTAAAAAEPGPWTRARHEHYAYLHAHLALEREHLAAALRGAKVLRDLAGGRAVAPGELAGRPALWAAPGSEDPRQAALLAAAAAATVPVLAAEAVDVGWLEGLLEGTGVTLVELSRGCALARADAGEAEPLRALVEAGLAQAGAVVKLAIGARLAAEGEPVRGGPGLELGRGAEGVLVLWSGQSLAAAAWRGATLWLDASDPLVRAAGKGFAGAPRAVARAVALAVRAHLNEGPERRRSPRRSIGWSSGQVARGSRLHAGAQPCYGKSVTKPEELQSWIERPREDEHFEFKLAQNQYDTAKLHRYCVALANEGGGRLVLGVTDKPPRRIVGSAAFPALQKTAEQIFDKLRFRVDAEEIMVDGARVVVFHVPARPQGTAYHYEGAYLMRSGEDLVPMSEDRLRRIFAEGGPEWPLRVARAGMSPEDVVSLLSTQAYFELVELPYPSTRESVLDRLQREGLIRQDGERWGVTNLGAVLFAKDLRDFELHRKAARVIVYGGVDKLDTRQERSFTAGYALSFPAVVAYVSSQLPSNEVIELALRRQVKRFPELAVRELTANAMLHQDFEEVGGAVMVEIYADRIEISNPGKPFIDLERFIDGYRSRNERLADLARRLRMCEEKGSGIDKVVSSAEVYQLPAPDFRSSEHRTTALLFAPKPFSEMNRSERVRACYQHCCLLYVMNRRMTNQTLRARFGFQDESKAATVSRILADAVEAGKIKLEDEESASRRYARYVPFWA